MLQTNRSHSGSKMALPPAGRLCPQRVPRRMRSVISASAATCSRAESSTGLAPNLGDILPLQLREKIVPATIMRRAADVAPPPSTAVCALCWALPQLPLSVVGERPSLNPKAAALSWPLVALGRKTSSSEFSSASSEATLGPPSRSNMKGSSSSSASPASSPLTSPFALPPPQLPKGAPAEAGRLLSLEAGCAPDEPSKEAVEAVSERRLRGTSGSSNGGTSQ
mmetsp:Transcript_73941/g.187524  ORF Transcript_73941/g.187524 Transcript_73941/m.187524 type:complete len:223 (+) Transcript_73941:176-844(+)